MVQTYSTRSRVIQLLKAGYPPPVIGRVVKVTRTRVHQIMQEHGIKKPRYTCSKYITEENMTTVWGLFSDYPSIWITAISAKSGLSHDIVRRILLELNLPRPQVCIRSVKWFDFCDYVRVDHPGVSLYRFAGTVNVSFPLIYYWRNVYESATGQKIRGPLGRGG